MGWLGRDVGGGSSLESRSESSERAGWFIAAREESWLLVATVEVGGGEPYGLRDVELQQPCRIRWISRVLSGVFEA